MYKLITITIFCTILTACSGSVNNQPAQSWNELFNGIQEQPINNDINHTIIELKK